jgi:hypothetical protein
MANHREENAGMYTYRCPGCGKYHAAEGTFERTYPTTCLRCGVAIAVTAELVHQAASAARPRPTPAAPAEDAITRTPTKEAVGVAGKRARAADLVEEQADLAPDADTEEAADAHDKEGKRRAEPARAKAAKKKPARRLPRRGEEDEEAEVQADDDVVPAKAAPRIAKAAAPDARKKKSKRAVIAGVVVAVLLVGGGAGFFLMGDKKEPEKKVASKAPSKTVQKATTPAKKVETPQPPQKTDGPPQPPQPRPKEPPTPDFILSAPRLSAELAASAIDTNTKYAGKAIQVSGLFEKIEKKDGLLPPPRPFAVFATRGKPISCDVQGSLSDPQRWSSLKANMPCTVLGIYERDGYLRDCWLLPKFISSADARYKRKPMEVEGYVQDIEAPTQQQEFPAIRLEGGTRGAGTILCLFRKNDADEIKKVAPRGHVTIQGICGGYQGYDEGGEVRLDNCQLVYTSTPAAGTPRLGAVQLLRTYAEDQNAYFLPPPGEEPRVEKAWTIRELAHEYAADPEAFDRKYLYHLFTVAGKTQKYMTKECQVVLESGDTDLTFWVDCYFSRGVLESVGKRSEYRIHGLYTGVKDKRRLRLDDCQADAPRRRGPVLTADFLPHTPGKPITYDVASFGVPVGSKIQDAVQRELHVQGKDGVTEVLVTHAGILSGKSLFDEGDPNRWLTQPKTIKNKAPVTSGVYLRRLSGGFVELGTPNRDDNGKTTVTWTPVLKLDARAGDHWEWTAPSGEHKYVLEQFGEHNGHTSATIRETITSADNINHPLEIAHVYAKDVGEVEQRQWMRLNSRGDKRLLGEKRMLDNKSSPGGKSPALRGAEPKKSAVLKEAAPAAR